MPAPVRVRLHPVKPGGAHGAGDRGRGPAGGTGVAIGRWFVGAPYTPGTLELRPERLVVNQA